MAVGILFVVRTPGYQTDLLTYLFGNIVMADAHALRLLTALDAVIIIFIVLFYKQLLAVCFDEEFARLRGVNVALFYTLLLVLTALTIVTLIYVVGIVLVIALLTLPVAVAGHFTKRMWEMMLVSAILSIIFTTAGLGISFSADLPAGATTILLAGAVYVVARLVSAPIARLFGSDRTH
jgi:zinc transport system permease protein